MITKPALQKILIGILHTEEEGNQSQIQELRKEKFS
jgi:hypothetical protein